MTADFIAIHIVQPLTRTLPWLIAGLCVLAGSTSVDLTAQRRGRGGADTAAQGRGRGDVSSTPGAKHEVKDASKKHAVCNDGSPAAFYFRPGKDPDRNKWLVFLQGGGACGTDHDCSTRWTEQHNLMTSVGLPQRKAEGGLLSDDEKENRDFARFTLVVVHYCSSDGYTGDAERTVDGRLLQFRGHRIVDAVIDDLLDSSVVGTPTLRQATEMLFAGSSAGAIGMQNNADRIAARLPGVKVKGVSDSGWAPDIAAFGPGFLEVRPDGPALVTYANAQPDESCVAAHPNDKGHCLVAPFLYSSLSTPMFFYADQRDPVHLGTYGIVGLAASPQQRAYVEKYRQQLRADMGKVPAAFVPDVNQHTSLANERFHSVVIDGHDLAETIGNWYFARSGPTHLMAPPTQGGRTRGAGAGAGRGGGG